VKQKFKPGDRVEVLMSNGTCRQAIVVGSIPGLCNSGQDQYLIQPAVVEVCECNLQHAQKVN
jgi:hypothetical protein